MSEKIYRIYFIFTYFSQHAIKYLIRTMIRTVYFLFDGLIREK